jgi:hypothetical protein
MNADIAFIPNSCCHHFYDFDDRRKYNGIASSKCKTYVGLFRISCWFYVDDFIEHYKRSWNLLLYYTSAYALAGIAAFSVIIYVCKNNENEDMANFHGLGKNNPLLAAIFLLYCLWLVPIFAGFFAKLFIQ